MKEIAVHSDASVDVVAFTIHIKSKDKAEKFKSHLPLQVLGSDMVLFLH